MQEQTPAHVPANVPERVFVIRVTDPGNDHALLGFAFATQTAFFPASGHERLEPEVRLTIDGLKQLFDKSGEYALAAVPFSAGHDPVTNAFVVGASVRGASVDNK